MQNTDGYTCRRTTTGHPDFEKLVQMLDHELWHELKEDQATYDQHNKVPDLQTAVVVYHEDIPVACGCFKTIDEKTVEVKRMFVRKEHRKKGLSKIVLKELEGWAMELGYRSAILETSIHFTVAQNLYKSFGYDQTPNYPPYVDLHESVCMKKALLP